MKKRRHNTRVPLILGASALGLLCLALGIWGLRANVVGAVIVHGTILGEDARHPLQHPDGGVIRALSVADGDEVEAGDVLLQLDDTYLRAELSTIEGQLAEFYARRARLRAERDNSDGLGHADIPEDFISKPELISHRIAAQAALLATRRASEVRQLQKLRDQRQQIEQQIAGIAAHRDATEIELQVTENDLAVAEGLAADGLITGQRLSELRRQEARLSGEFGHLRAAIGEARARQAALLLEAESLVSDRRQRAMSDLHELNTLVLELEQRRLALMERHSRLVVTAPVAGSVNFARVLTKGSVLRPTEPALSIVPRNLPIRVRARVDVHDVDSVWPGQPVRLVFPGFDRERNAELPGSVLRIAADASVSAEGQQRGYEAVFIPDSEAVQSRSDLNLKPGMPVEAYIVTGSRTPVAYLADPLVVYFRRALQQ